MKVNKAYTFNEVKENYRTQNILDENVLHALSQIDRRDFVPDGFDIVTSKSLYLTNNLCLDPPLKA